MRYGTKSLIYALDKMPFGRDPQIYDAILNFARDYFICQYEYISKLLARASTTISLLQGSEVLKLLQFPIHSSLPDSFVTSLHTSDNQIQNSEQLFLQRKRMLCCKKNNI